MNVNNMPSSNICNGKSPINIQILIGRSSNIIKLQVVDFPTNPELINRGSKSVVRQQQWARTPSCSNPRFGLGFAILARPQQFP